MKRIYLLLAVIITAFAFAVNLQAQTTDVTASYLLNTGFETNPTGAASDNYIYDVDGWTEYRPAGALDYYKLATVGYESVTSPLGTAPTNESSVTVDNATLLGVKLHWYPGDAVYVEQTATLPAGKYTLTWDSFVKQTVSNQASRMGYIVDEIATYDNLPSAVDTWKNHSLTFTLLAEKAVTFRFGYSKTANTGGTTSPILFVDNVKLVVFNVIDKSELLNQLNIAKDMAADPQPVGTSTAYAELDAAITSAQAIYDDPDATLVQVTEQEDALKVAIANVNSAIVIYGRVSTWTTLPYNATSVIVNPTIEGTDNNTAPNGWTVSKGSGNTMTTTGQHYSSVTTNRYFDSWNGTAGALLYTAQQTIKDIPNGIYTLKAAARTSGAGSYIYAKTSGNTYRTEIINLGSVGGTLGNGFNTITVEVPVLDNTMTIGVTTDVSVSGGSAWAGTWFSADDFTLSYISDGSPYLVVAPESLFFDLMTSTRTFTVNGGNLTANATLTAPAGVTLDNTSLTPAEVAAGATVTATHDGSTAIASGEITISTTGATNSIVTVNAEPDNATSAIVNPNFSSGTTGWTSTTSAQNKTTATNQNVGAFEGTMPFYENWNSTAYTGKIYQIVNNLPAGRYLLKMGVFANNGGEGLFVYGDSYETPVSNANVPAFFEVEFVTPGGSAEIGLNIKSGTNNWVGIDNVSLKYLGTVSEPAVSVSASNLLFTETDLTKTFTLTGLNLTADILLVSNVAGVTLNPATVSKDDAELVAGKTITATFDPAAEGAGSLTGTITASTAGVADKTIAIATSKDSGCFTPLYNDRTNLVLDPFCNDRSKFGGWGSVEVSNTTVLCGLRSIKVSGGSLDVSVAGGAAIESNKTYRVKAYIYVPAGHTAKFGTFLIGNSGDEDVYTSTTNDTWEEVDFNFKTATVTTGGVFFQRVSGSDGVYIDNYELYDVTDIVAGVKNTSSNEMKVFVQNNSIIVDANTIAAGNAEIGIYNLQGARIHTENTYCNAGYNRFKVNRELPSGVYFVKLNIDGEVTTTKLVK